MNEIVSDSKTAGRRLEWKSLDGRIVELTVPAGSIAEMFDSITEGLKTYLGRANEAEKRVTELEAQSIRFMKALTAIAHGALNPASVARNTLAVMDATRPEGFEYPAPGALCEHWKTCRACPSPAFANQARKLEDEQRERAEKAEAEVASWKGANRVLTERILELTSTVDKMLGFPQWTHLPLWATRILVGLARPDASALASGLSMIPATKPQQWLDPVLDDDQPARACKGCERVFCGEGYCSQCANKTAVAETEAKHQTERAAEQTARAEKAEARVAGLELVVQAWADKYAAAKPTGEHFTFREADLWDACVGLGLRIRVPGLGRDCVACSKPHLGITVSHAGGRCPNDATALDDVVIPRVAVERTRFIEAFEPGPEYREFLRFSKEGVITLGPDITWDAAAGFLVAALERKLGVRATAVVRTDNANPGTPGDANEALRARVAELEAVLRSIARDGSYETGRDLGVRARDALKNIAVPEASPAPLCSWCDRREATKTDAHGQRVCSECYEGASRTGYEIPADSYEAYASRIRSFERSDALSGNGSTLHCSCGASFTWCGTDEKLRPWVDAHHPHLGQRTNEAKLSLEQQLVDMTRDRDHYREELAKASRVRASRPDKATADRVAELQRENNENALLLKKVCQRYTKQVADLESECARLRDALKRREDAPAETPRVVEPEGSPVGDLRERLSRKLEYVVSDVKKSIHPNARVEEVYTPKKPGGRWYVVVSHTGEPLCSVCRGPLPADGGYGNIRDMTQRVCSKGCARAFRDAEPPRMPIDGVDVEQEHKDRNAAIIASAECVAALAQVLIAVEWQGVEDFVGDGGFDCCPSCRGVAPNHETRFDARNAIEKGETVAGHKTDCALAATLRKAGVR